MKCTEFTVEFTFNTTIYNTNKYKNKNNKIT